MLDAASEFSEPLALDIATAMIDASSNPASPTGISRTRYSGKIRSTRSPGASSGVLREHEEQDSDQQKHGELHDHDYAAGHQCASGVALIPRGQQSLHDGLVGAVTCHRQECAADDAGPKRIFRRPMKRKIEYLQFVAGGGRDLRHFSPSAGNAMQQKPQASLRCPPSIRRNCATSVQITAFIPPSSV